MPYVSENTFRILGHQKYEESNSKNELYVDIWKSRIYSYTQYVTEEEGYTPVTANILVTVGECYTPVGLILLVVVEECYTTVGRNILVTVGECYIPVGLILLVAVEEPNETSIQYYSPL